MILSSSQSSGIDEEEQKIVPNMLYVASHCKPGSFTRNQIHDELQEIFQQYGDVELIIVHYHDNWKYFFSFVRMKNHQQASNCIKYINKRKFGQSELKVDQYRITKSHSNFFNKNSTRKYHCFSCGSTDHSAAQCNEIKKKRSSRLYRKKSNYAGFSNSSSSEEDEEGGQKKASKYKYRRNRQRSYSVDRKKRVSIQNGFSDKKNNQKKDFLDTVSSSSSQW